ncbi:DNA polymerase III subunit gamma/tau [Patescibacteria group bacterium]|nr:DNA polymerase III subunit gamma/tau [Patescibacteria group bacterium]
MSYYLKYRPQRVDELDLTDVRENLLGVLKGGNLSHAYLFVGPRGSGKTSAARILAAAVNCEVNSKDSGQARMTDKKVLREPCGKCKVCKGIKVGNQVDVLEMDAASHRGIDDIRNLKERIRLAPVSLPKKVYIIDEVHMLTKEAFNALLKVLEEPPKHVMFFLCTTEEHKVPETIISRCTKIAFTKAIKKEVESALQKVIKGEKLKIDKEAVGLLAESVDGSFREGHKLLEQLAVDGKKITKQEVEKMLGLAGGDDVVELLKMSLEGRSKEIGKKLGELEKKGVSASSLLGDLLRGLQGMIRAPHQTVQGDKVRLAGLLIESAEKLKVSPLPFLPIELALLEVGMEGGEKIPTPIASDKLRDSSTRRLGRNDKEKNRSRTKSGMTKKKEVLKQVQNDEKISKGNNILSLSKIEEEWGKLLDRLSEKNRSVAGLLRASKPKVADGNHLTVEVFYEFHKSQLEQDSKRLLVEQAAEELWGPTVLRCVLGEKQHKPSVSVDRVIEVDDYVKAAEDVFGN